MMMPGRTYTNPNLTDTTGDRFGFNGMERDDEAKGKGNSYDFGARIYDPRIGRFLSLDPLSKDYPEWAPYVFSGNQVVHTIELEGAEPLDRIGLGDQKGWIPQVKEIFRDGDTQIFSPDIKSTIE